MNRTFVFFVVCLQTVLGFTWHNACKGCYGPNAGQCVTCAFNAHWNANGDCECNSGFAGPECGRPLSASIQIFDGYIGNNHYHGGMEYGCHPVCGDNGCAGPYASDCNECNMYSQQINQYCSCISGYYGYDCMQSYTIRNAVYDGLCSPTCGFSCFGPDPCDCNDCVLNAHFDYWGYCVCDSGFYGMDCSHRLETTVYTGYCDHACSATCFGPSAYECELCIGNAYRDAYGYCTCQYGYYGDGCTVSYMVTVGYQGTCHPMWATCYGPERADCSTCVDNAFFDPLGWCECEEHWDGEDCSQWAYAGHCAPACGKCKGPFPEDCTACTERAVWNSDGVCECIPYFKGNECDTEMYRGSCDPKCDGCTGPDPNECIQCVENAEWNEYRYCICKAFYTDDTCSTYTNTCNPKCGFWGGPLASHCTVCVENASMDELGFCVWDYGFDGEDCSVYIGECFHTCRACFGPKACDCYDWVLHATKDEHGCCHCNDYWINASCLDYVGPCDPICNGCSSESITDCDYCVFRASKDNNNVCNCDPNWGGADCSVYSGFCDDKCLYCYGPGGSDCYTCIENASFDNHGYCVCDSGWNGEYCVDYNGPCHGYCASQSQHQHPCFGRSSHDCVKCTTNSLRESDGFCVCSKPWGGDDCQNFMGQCDARCNGCHGPTNLDCESWVVNTTVGPSGYASEAWVCDSGWAGPDCSFWANSCYPTCKICTGPLQSDCVKCVDNAHRQEVSSDVNDGVCICYDDWSMEINCSKYNGACDPRCAGSSGPSSCSGPSNIDCDMCGQNAHREESSGSCVCDQYWAGDSCDLWTGYWDPRCLDSCTGPSNADCISCVPNATEVLGACICDSGWTTVDDCSEFRLACDSKWSMCNADQPSECYECVLNAARHISGQCECDSNWSGGECTEFDQQQCFITCSQCNGPSMYDWQECVAHAHRDYFGRCICEDGWESSDCSKYSGPCSHKCANGCVGPTKADCNSCIEHAGGPDGCECDEGWTGQDCNTYQGKCHDRCEVWTGPEDANWVLCSKNAWRVSGLCQCMPGWTNQISTENCLHEILVCHVSCRACDGKQQNECTDCHPGFFLAQDGNNPDGFCIPCDETCKECDGITSQECTACFDGETTTAEVSSCVCCHPSCKTCDGLEACTDCYAGSELVGSHCVCLDDKVRDPYTFGCVEFCPVGYSKDLRSSSCIEDTFGQVYADLGSDLVNTVSSSITFDNSCHNPQQIQREIDDKGNVNHYVFNGENTSIQLGNFIPGDKFYISLRFQPASGYRDSPVGSIFSFKANVADPVAVLADYDNTCQLGNNYEIQSLIFDIWLDSCLYLHASIGDQVIQFDDEPMFAVDAMEFLIVKFYIDANDLKVQITHSVHDGNQIMRARLLKNKKFMFNSYDDVEFYIGNYLGVSSFFRGLVTGFDIRNHENNDFWRAQLPSTNWEFGEFEDNGLCYKCHPSCDACFDSAPCSVCHSTCATCTDSDNPGSADECLTCYWGAEKDVEGHCRCMDDYYGPADNCQLKCAEGCADCVGLGQTDCITCELNYEMSVDCPGECEWCDVNACDEDGLPLCGHRGGPFTLQSKCDCGPGQWFDGNTCRFCANGCLLCDRSDNGRCDLCESGLYSWDQTDGCFDFVPFGYRDCGGAHLQCKTLDSEEVFNFEFTVPADGCQIWEYRKNISHYLVRIFGGNQETIGEIEEPIIFSDRGAWFDGKYDLMTFSLLKPPPSPSLRMWINPHSDGVLQSSNEVHDGNQYTYEAPNHNNIDWSQMLPGVDYTSDGRVRRDILNRKNEQQQRFYRIAINSGRMEYTNSASEIVRTDTNSMEYFQWQHVYVNLQFRDNLAPYRISIGVNGAEIVTDQAISKWHDFPEPKHSHLVGAGEAHGSYIQHYRGFIKSIAMHFTEGDYGVSSQGCIGACLYCHEVGSACYGNCGWNHFSDGQGGCIRCPLWCSKGCENGAC